MRKYKLPKVEFSKKKKISEIKNQAEKKSENGQVRRQISKAQAKGLILSCISYHPSKEITRYDLKRQNILVEISV